MRFEIGKTLIEIRASFFLVVAFMLLICDSETVLISLFSSLLHECGHMIAIISVGERIERLLFSASGLRIDRKYSSSLGFGKEIIISAAGVTVNLLICLFSYAVFLCRRLEIAYLIFAVNAAVGLFNMMPVESLDGERILMFIFCLFMPEEKAQMTVTDVSVVTTLLLVLFFIVTVYMKKVNPSLAVVTIYLVIILINRIFELKKSKI